MKAHVGIGALALLLVAAVGLRAGEVDGGCTVECEGGVAEECGVIERPAPPAQAVPGEDCPMARELGDLRDTQAAMEAEWARVRAGMTTRIRKLERDVAQAEADRDGAAREAAAHLRALQAERTAGAAAVQEAAEALSTAQSVRIGLEQGQVALERDLTEVKQRNAELTKKLAALREELDQRARELMNQRRQWLHEVRNVYRIEQGEAAVRRGEAIREVMTNPFNPALAWSLADVALLHAAGGQPEAAEPLLRRALFILELSEDDTQVARAVVLQHLAEMRRSAHDLAAASDLYREAAYLFEAGLGPRHLRMADALNGWAGVLRDAGRLPEAERIYRRCVEIHLSQRARALPAAAAAPLHNLGLLLAAQERIDEAEVLLLRALRILEEQPSAFPEGTSTVLRSLARLCAESGRLEQAMLYEQRASENDARMLTSHHMIPGTIVPRGGRRK